MDGEQLKAIEERSEAAHKMINDLCEGKRDWLMSIPARPDHDPDLVISASLRDVSALLAKVRRLQAALETEREHSGIISRANTRLSEHLGTADAQNEKLRRENLELRASVIALTQTEPAEK